MKTLIMIRDNIKDFVAKYEKFVMPVLKFFATLLVLISFNSVMGYSSEMSSPALMFIISLLGAFLPVQLTVLLVGLVGAVHMYEVSLEVLVIYVGLALIMYLLYMRFAPKYGWLIILMPLLYMFKLHYMIPIIVGIFIGPIGIIPVAFGVIFYYFTQHVSDLVDLLATSASEDSVQALNYVINGLLHDKPMLLTIVVFAIVIAVTYLIYRQSFQYSWMVAIGSGAILSIVLFLMGGIVLEADIDILVIFIGTVVGALLSVVAQFFKGILDYSRTENVQFEDDEYYYYVKAIPKVRVAERKVRVKKINERQSAKDDEDDFAKHSAKATQTTTTKASQATTTPRGAQNPTRGNQTAANSNSTAVPNRTASSSSNGSNNTGNRAAQAPTGAGKSAQGQKYSQAQRQAQNQVYNNTRR